MNTGELFEESSAAAENACELPFLDALLAVTVGIAWYVSRPSDSSKLPPGPKGVPMLGYISFLGRSYHLKFAELAYVYGPIVRAHIYISVVYTRPSPPQAVEAEEHEHIIRDATLVLQRQETNPIRS
ncbi:hypothetical protein HPB47_017524 [Ixodes persulcatus]|uniref:Uncharacterized protein n=1 Tax=Ixodes persulcatus TaxID=34615 RepID=A0AC60QN18_IXOPE|nr:hypothetical protein HPB47_017524 [Ixodes persulcatus]